MIFADKLIQLRKKSGWSQEELAQQMGVSRQSVSKWEGAQAVPDLEKMLKLSQLFGVSTDYLLKDELEAAEATAPAEDTAPVLRRVSMEEASDFIALTANQAPIIALGVVLCILCPVCLIGLSGLAECGTIALSESTAAAIGVLVLIGMVATAVGLFLYSASRLTKYSYLEKEVFETEYGVTGMVQKHKEAFAATYNRNNLIGVLLCILAAAPLFLGVLLFGENTQEGLVPGLLHTGIDPDIAEVFCLLLLFVLVATAVYLFVRAGTVWGSFQRLLEEGDYTRLKKRHQGFTSVYWALTLTLYLGVSLITMAWASTWVIWPIAAVLYPAAFSLAVSFSEKK